MEGRIATTETPNAGAPSATLSVHVLATAVEGTRCALTSAKRLTDGLDARIVLLVPRLTSFAASSDPASDDRAASVDEHRAIAASVGAHVTVLFCMCRRLDDVVHSMLGGGSSIVIVGGRRRVWWPSREQRLVRRLTAAGYPVVFAQVGAEHAAGGRPRMAS